MLDFRRKTAVPNYLSGRQQWRVLFWVLLIGLPVIAVLRLFDLASRPAQSQAAAVIDPRLPDRTGRTEMADVFTSHASVDDAQEDTTGRYFAGVKPAYLETVRDDTPSRPADREACFNLLGVLHETSDEQLFAASLGPTSYVQLFQQPNVYRGRLVDLSGSVRRAARLELPENDVGLSHYYQVWIHPEGVNNPVVVYVLDLPEQFPTGGALREPVTLTGFFFKRVAYLAKGGPMTAPMLLARTVRWTQPAPGDGTSSKR